MRSTIGLGVLALLLTLAVQASATPISIGSFAADAKVITFETGTANPPTIAGVHFANDGVNFGGSCAHHFTDAQFGQEGYANLLNGKFTDLGISFDTPVQAVGGWAGKGTNYLNTSPASIDMLVYSASDTLLETISVTLPNTFNVPTFVGVTRSEKIARVEWRCSNGGFFAIDNVMYGNAVPEPSSLVLVGAAAVAMLTLARRR
jgi:hypothetical protein